MNNRFFEIINIIEYIIYLRDCLFKMVKICEIFYYLEFRYKIIYYYFINYLKKKYWYIWFFVNIRYFLILNDYILLFDLSISIFYNVCIKIIFNVLIVKLLF